MTNPVRVLICGGGNAAHVMAGLAATRQGVEVRVLTIFADEADKWTEAMKLRGFNVIIKGHRGQPDIDLQANPFTVSKYPEEVVPGCDLVVFAVPAYGHAQYLNAMKPFLKPGSLLVALPGSSGFEFEVNDVLKDVAKSISVMTFDTLPWAARLKEYGHSVEVLGIKKVIHGALHGNCETVFPHDRNAVETLQYLVGEVPVLDVSGHILGITLLSPNAYVHPTMMYAEWANWDGQPVSRAPLLYHGVTDSSIKEMTQVHEEVEGLAKRIMELRPNVDLSKVKGLFPYILEIYEDHILDKSNLKTAFLSNTAYEGLRFPMVATEDGKLSPDFNNRYLSEDIPYGLVVIRGIAEIVGVDTPHIDKVLLWSQEKLGKEFLIDGHIAGKHVPESRSPQAYGMTTLDEILWM
ncbi:tauropine dehydrogenase [Lingula anatina]|uniref:Tauropine dehydrogenase n=1 Tax=Lingula anatina TaxID=7574 RepID=A0A1S3JK84_LINAN|nr:tauropine dehydrogenase [Lingula anatina]|eukprot:XP_013410787.1 tauropine dehydrogenase [Lingula anatina]